MRLADHFRYRVDELVARDLYREADELMINGTVRGWKRVGHVNLVSVQVINTTTFVRRGHLFI